VNAWLFICFAGLHRACVCVWDIPAPIELVLHQHYLARKLLSDGHLPGQHRRPEEALTFVLQWRGGNVDPTARWPPHAFPSMAEPTHPSLPPIVRLQRRPRWCLRTLLLSLRLVLPLRLGRGPKPPAQGVRADEHLRGA